MKVVVLHNVPADDGLADDQDILTQRDVVMVSLRNLGHEPVAVGCTLDLAEVVRQLHKHQPDVVFNLVESLHGTDRLAPAATLLLESLGIPYTGVRTLAFVTTIDKLATKQVLWKAGLPTAPWFTSETGCWNGLPSSGPAASRPIRKAILKAIWEHASFGMADDAVVELDDDDGNLLLAELLASRLKTTGRPFFAEPFLEGREFNLTVLCGKEGPQVLPPAEIDFSAYPADKPRIVGYQAKWDEQSFEYDNTPRHFDFPDSDSALLSELQELARQCWHLFELHGYARVDFRVDESGRPWILEINANPCLSPDAGLAAAVKQAGLSFDEVVERILADVF